MELHGRPGSTLVHRVVVIGSGFGGLFTVKGLRHAPVLVTLIDRTSEHLFQPLLYQVATGILSEGEIAPPVRDVLRHQDNVQVARGNVTSIDINARTVTVSAGGVERVTVYDSLVVAAGAGQSYFGHDAFEMFAPGMKSIDDAIALRARIFGAFELAELETVEARRNALLTFVVVGAGPTGVEMAGQLVELSRRSMHRNFRTIDPAQARVVLIEAGPRVLPAFGDRLSDRAARDLRRLGIDLRVGSSVVEVDERGVEVVTDGLSSRIDAATVIWAAGVSASPLGGLLAHATGAEVTRSGQLVVLPDLTLPGHPEVFVIGDMMRLGQVPGDAQAAIQSGRFAARRIADRARGLDPSEPFHYRNRGRLATISRFRAVAAIGPLRLTGFIAWVLWLIVHLVNLVGFKNRWSVLMHWSVTFVGRSRSERTAPFSSQALPNLGQTQSSDASEAGPQHPMLDVEENHSRTSGGTS